MDDKARTKKKRWVGCEPDPPAFPTYLPYPAYLPYPPSLEREPNPHFTDTLFRSTEVAGVIGRLQESCIGLAQIDA